MKCSVIIPTSNNEQTIKQCLNSLKSQTYKNYEVVIVDDGSTDKTIELIKKYRVKLLKRKTRSNPASARNFGVKNSKGDILIFTDADCVADKSWIKQILKSFSNPKTGSVSGSLTNATKNIYANAIHFCWASSLSPKLPSEERILATSANMAVKRKVFVEIGGFDERMDMAEDSDLSIRMCKKGYKIIYQPKAKVTHIQRRTTFLSFLKHRFNHGLWEAINILKYKPLQPTSKYFSRNWLFMLLFLPFLVIFSTGNIIKKNFSHTTQVFKYIPLIFIGRLAWSIGVIKGTYKFKQEFA